MGLSKTKRAAAAALAKQILKTVKRLVKGGRVRFGRLTRVDRQFIGEVVDVVWNTVGSSFSFICMYNGRQHTHASMLRAMLADYSCSQRPAKRPKHTKRPKRALKDTNVSTDLEFEIRGTWHALGSFFPSKVRQLKPVESAQWLHKHQSDQGTTENTDENLERTVSPREPPDTPDERCTLSGSLAPEPKIKFFQTLTTSPVKKKQQCVLSSTSPVVPLHTTASQLAPSEFCKLLSSVEYLQAYGDRCVSSELAVYI